MKKIYCVIPAFNEEKNIINTIKQVKEHVDEVIIIDDGSTDKTSELANTQGVSVIKHVINRGQGASLQTGNEYAIKMGADIIVHFDADGQFLANEINDVVKPIIESNHDVVLGSRFLGKKSNIPWTKEYIIFPIANLFNKIFLGVNLTDPQNGFRAMSSRFLNKIFIENDGSAHCSEILFKAFRNKYKIAEVPVTVIYKDYGQNILKGKGRGSGGIRIIKDLIWGKLIN